MKGEVETAQQTSMKPTSPLSMFNKIVLCGVPIHMEHKRSPWSNVHSAVLSRGFQNGVWEPLRGCTEGALELH